MKEISDVEVDEGKRSKREGTRMCFEVLFSKDRSRPPRSRSDEMEEEEKEEGLC